MNLRFHSIKIHNFMSYSEADIPLNNLGQVLVTGENHNPTDSAVSNGSGKSTIFNAICFALTGLTTQGLSRNIENINGDPNDCWVELNFDVDGDNFLVRRTKTPKSNMKIYINGEDRSGKGINESKDLLSQYIPDLTYNLISAIIILGQGLPNKFMNNKPSHRKEALEELTRTDFMIADLRDKIDSRLLELQNQLKEKEDALLVNTTKKDMFEKQLAEYTKQLEECDHYNSEYTLESRITYLNDKLSKLDHSIESKQLAQRNINAYVENLVKEKEQYNQQALKERLDLSQDKDSELYNINSLKVAEDVKIKSLEKEIKKLKSITDICPTCGQKIPGAHKVDTSEKESQLKELKSYYDQLVGNEAKALEDKKITLNNFDCKMNNRLKNYDLDLVANREMYKVAVEVTNKEAARKTKALTELAKVENMKENYDKLSGMISNVTNNLSTLAKEKRTLDKELVNINEHLYVVKEMLNLARKDFRGILLQHVVEYLNNKIKQYSQIVFGNDNLSFLIEDNYIGLKYDNKLYDNLSGGEKQKADIMLQLAIRELLSNQLGIRSNILCIDECFDNLDSIGCRKILELITNINDIESIFIITHHKETLEITYDTEIVVKKNENGISTISIV